MAPFTRAVLIAKRAPQKLPQTYTLVALLLPMGTRSHRHLLTPSLEQHSTSGHGQPGLPTMMPSAELRMMNCFFFPTARRRFEVVPHSNLHVLFTEQVAATG